MTLVLARLTVRKHMEENGAGNESVDEPAEEEWQEASPAIFIATVSFNLPGKHGKVAVV